MAEQRKISDFFGKKRKVAEEENAGEKDENTAESSTSHEIDSEMHSASTSTTASEKLKKQKRAKEFDQKWKDGRPWLIYKSSDGMFCQYCTEFNKTPFGRTKWNKTGCNRIREESVKDHEITDSHRDAVGLHLQREVSKHIGDMVTKPQEISTDGMVKAFQCLYFLAKHNIAHTTNFSPLLDLLTQLGLDVKSKLYQGANAKYTSNTSIKEFLECLSEVIEQDNLSDMRNSKYFSLMFDETTDVSTIEQMVIHGRYIDDNGQVTTKFLKIVDCLETENEEEESLLIRLNSEKIAGKITGFIEKEKLPYEKLVGLGTDGAAVMVGKVNGTVKKIIDRQISQQDTTNPCKALGQHCAAHKLNLAASKAGNTFPAIVRFKKLLHKLHAFYSRSAIRTKGLEIVQKLLSDSLEACGKVHDPAETRWLALGKCTVALKNILPSVLVSLENEGQEKGDVVAAGLYQLMTRWEFLSVLLLLCDILPTVNRLSSNFQESLLDFAKIEQSVEGTIKSLTAKKDTPVYNDNFQKLIESLNKQKIHIKFEEVQLADFHQRVKRPFIDCLVNNISDRFVNNSTMEAFSHIVDNEFYTESKLDELKDSVRTLANQFGFSHEEADSEVQDIIHYLPKEANLAEVLISPTIGAQFPVLSNLAKIYKTLPPHTADCERDFSRMGIIKTEIRNRLSEDSLDCLMRISINGPPSEEFPYSKAVKLWAQKKNRRYNVRLT